MPINILMPALSPTMEKGKVARWLVKEGDAVTSGSVIAEIETDKATMEFEAVDEGRIGRIVVPDGTEGVKVNDLIAILLEEGETADALGATAPEKQVARPAKAPPAMVHAALQSMPQQSMTVESGDRLFASPLARRTATDRGLDLRSIKGTGPNGRIIRVDVEAARVETKGKSAAPASSAAEPVQPAATANASHDAEAIKKVYADRPFEEVKLDGMRRTIAVRLTEAKQTIPHFYLRRDVRLDPLLAFRSKLNTQLRSRGVKLSVNDFIIKACALALQQVPECNAVWAGDRLLRLKHSDVAVAVAIEGGLFTPVIRDAEKKTISVLSAEMKDLAARARDRKLAPHEYLGGTFAISNLGMMGVESFDAVINPPHASIVAVGAGVSKPIIGEGGEIEVATMMSLTLSVDHRVIDGVLGASFLAAVKENLEHPISMLA